jgi:hypothetical protein
MQDIAPKGRIIEVPTIGRLGPWWSGMNFTKAAVFVFPARRKLFEFSNAVSMPFSLHEPVRDRATAN